MATRVGLPADTVLRIDVDENEPLGRTIVESLDPIVLKVEGGAFEDAKRPWKMSDRGIVDVMRRRVIELDEGDVVRDQARGVYE